MSDNRSTALRACDVRLVKTQRGMRRRPSEHAIAHAMKKSSDLALFEAVLLALPLDAAARRSALAAFQAYWHASFVRQHLDGGPSKSNPFAVVVAVEALGLRGIELDGHGGIIARLPDGSQIHVPGVTGPSPQRQPVDAAHGTAAAAPQLGCAVCTPLPAANGGRT